VVLMVRLVRVPVPGTGILTTAMLHRRGSDHHDAPSWWLGRVRTGGAGRSWGAGASWPVSTTRWRAGRRGSGLVPRAARCRAPSRPELLAAIGA